MLRTLGLLCLVVIFCLVAAIGYFNLAAVQFDYLFGSTEIHLVLLLLIVFALGVGLTLLCCSIGLLGQHRELRRLRRQLNQAEAELKNLRTLPLKSA
ncbi:MAG: DUF1049 domain-containing protein [Nevskiaceae bacterium]|nr:MAG: DUF1049 domain-containing protein [Nevskiaceae bacterium]TBR74775.1 MAG: DUF1049 domain-containing protein [Nevskiaceae bacterium]